MTASAAISQKSDYLFAYAAAIAAAFFRFLRQPNKPIAPRPVAKSGRDAGSGVVATDQEPSEVLVIVPVEAPPGPELTWSMPWGSGSNIVGGNQSVEIWTKDELIVADTTIFQ